MRLALLLLSVFTLFVFNSCGILRNMMTKETFDSTGEQSSKVYYTSMVWTSDSLGEEKIEKSALFVPVKLNGISENLFMQLDIGSTSSMIYENPLIALKKKYPQLSEHIKRGEKSQYFSTARLNIHDSLSLSAEKLYIFENFGQKNLDTSFVNFGQRNEDTAFVILGTLGYDILGQNALILDFKKDRYALTKNIPDRLEENAYYIEGADLDKYPVVLPFRFGDKKINLIYDSGASAYPIITGTKKLRRIAGKQTIDTLSDAHSFGEYYLLCRLNKVDSLKAGNIDFGKVDVYGYDKKLFNRLWLVGVYGFTGNILFDDSILILDRIDNRFGVVR